jgi:glutathione S-transferase
MKQRVQIIGNFLSPYVRKVLVCLDLKGVPYDIEPIVPFFGDDRFSQVSPVRRIPVLIDEQVTLADSSFICQYLEDRFVERVLRIDSFEKLKPFEDRQRRTPLAEQKGRARGDGSAAHPGHVRHERAATWNDAH